MDKIAFICACVIMLRDRVNGLLELVNGWFQAKKCEYSMTPESIRTEIQIVYYQR